MRGIDNTIDSDFEKHITELMAPYNKCANGLFFGSLTLDYGSTGNGAPTYKRTPIPKTFSFKIIHEDLLDQYEEPLIALKDLGVIADHDHSDGVISVIYSDDQKIVSDFLLVLEKKSGVSVSSEANFPPHDMQDKNLLEALCNKCKSLSKNTIQFDVRSIFDESILHDDSEYFSNENDVTKINYLAASRRLENEKYVSILNVTYSKSRDLLSIDMHCTEKLLAYSGQEKNLARSSWSGDSGNVPSTVYNSSTGILTINEISIPFPPETNQRLMLEQAFEVGVNQPLDWSVFYEKITGIEIQFDENNTAKEKRVVYDAHRAVNKLVSKLLGSEVKLIACERNTVRRIM